MGHGPAEPEHAPVAFGLGLLTTDLEPPGAWEPRPLSGPTLRLRSGSPQAIAERWSGLESIGWAGTIDGAPFVAQRGRAGDHRFVHGADPDEGGGARRTAAGTRAIHHLSADACVLTCAPCDPSEPSWWRLVLDSVLFTVALIDGYEALHAAAVVAPDGGVIAITAAMGGGKSTLLFELLGRGLPLMADDVLVLEPSRTDRPPLAHPAPPLMTVPTARLSTLTHAPEPICTLGEERWIAVPSHPQPRPLRALVVLDRRRDAQLSLTQIDDPFAPLMRSLMRFPRTPERERSRFELASVLATTTALLRLTADLDTPPEALADALLEGVLDRGLRPTAGATHVCADAGRC